MCLLCLNPALTYVPFESKCFMYPNQSLSLYTNEFCAFSLIYALGSMALTKNIIPFLKNNLSLSNSLNLLLVAFTLFFLDILIFRFGIK